MIKNFHERALLCHEKCNAVYSADAYSAAGFNFFYIDLSESYASVRSIADTTVPLRVDFASPEVRSLLWRVVLASEVPPVELLRVPGRPVVVAFVVAPP